MVSKIHHVGIVVRAIRDAYGFWRDVLGLPGGLRRVPRRVRQSDL